MYNTHRYTEYKIIKYYILLKNISTFSHFFFLQLFLLNKFFFLNKYKICFNILTSPFNISFNIIDQLMHTLLPEVCCCDRSVVEKLNSSKIYASVVPH